MIAWNSIPIVSQSPQSRKLLLWSCSCNPGLSRREVHQLWRCPEAVATHVLEAEVPIHVMLSGFFGNVGHASSLQCRQKSDAMRDIKWATFVFFSSAETIQTLQSLLILVSGFYIKLVVVFRYNYEVDSLPGVPFQRQGEKGCSTSPSNGGILMFLLIKSSFDSRQSEQCSNPDSWQWQCRLGSTTWRSSTASVHS